MLSKFLKFFNIGETQSAKIGRLGEDVAVKFLKKNLKFKIIKRNYRIGKSEIDIIAKDCDVLVFVEVKTRSENALVSGYTCAKNKNKINALKRGARKYMFSLLHKPTTWRYDVVEVRHNDKLQITSVNHYENIG